MRRRATLSVIGALSVLTVLAPSLASATGSDGPPAPLGGWSPAGFTDTARSTDLLEGVSAVAADDVWAVGLRRTGARQNPLVKRWDGQSWSVVPSPRPGIAPGGMLFDVDARSADDVWAVGMYVDVQHHVRSLVEHWNGTAWKLVSTPDLPGEDWLRSVSTVSGRDVWAVGYRFRPDKSILRPLALRWNGHIWSTVDTPEPKGARRALLGVDAATHSSGWAVGETGPHYGPQTYPLAEHWNGHDWLQVAVPHPSRSSSLAGVSIVAPGDVWAVGSYLRSTSQFALVERFVHHHWVRVSPGLGSGSYLVAVSGNAANDVWAVGAELVEGHQRAALVHWDGQRWQVYNGLAPGSTTLKSVTTRGTTSTWAGGFRSTRSREAAVQERWNGHAWTR